MRMPWVSALDVLVLNRMRRMFAILAWVGANVCPKVKTVRERARRGEYQCQSGMSIQDLLVMG